MTVANQSRIGGVGVGGVLAGVDWEGAWLNCGDNQTIRQPHKK